MTITLHHLGVAQSEKIVWLLEELDLEYKLIKHTRDPLLSPESLKSIPGNETGLSSTRSMNSSALVDKLYAERLLSSKTMKPSSP